MSIGHLRIILYSFIYNVVCSDLEWPLSLMDALNPISSSFILSIQCIDSEWFLSNAFDSPARTFNSLQSFLDTLANNHHPKSVHLQLQLETLPTNLRINMHTLSHIINASDIHISHLIVPSYIQMLEIQTISHPNLPIVVHLHDTKRTLLSNDVVSTTEYEMLPVETYLCEPWPIYIAFFCGIGVTVLITSVINLTTGEKDTELHNALEKLITAGADNHVKKKTDVLNVSGPTRHKRGRTNSLIILNQLSPKSRSRSVVFVKGNTNHTRKYTNEPSWANDLNLNALPTIHSMTNDNLNSLKIQTDLEEREDIRMEITPKQEDIRNSSSETLHSYRSSEDISVSELIARKSASSDEDLESIDDDEVKQETMAQYIDLSPIEESDAHVEEFRMCAPQRYRVKKRNDENTGAQYIKRLSGKTIRVGFESISGEQMNWNDEVESYKRLETHISSETMIDYNDYIEETSIMIDSQSGDTVEKDEDEDDEIP
eukprot:292487_1